MTKQKRGFTLLELAVTVIIIAALAMVALPMYKHAVLKSRFSTVMPVAKAVADAQEVYYLGRNMYALGIDELDVVALPDADVAVSMSNMDGYDYVLAQHSNIPDVNYIMYQQHSENYPGEIHCEAKDNQADAQWLCNNLGATRQIGSTLHSGYTTFLLSGNGIGFPSWAANIDCSDAQDLGFTCTPIQDKDGNSGKRICKDGVCRTRYDETEGYTSITCVADSEGLCISDWKSATYDKAGNKIRERVCAVIAEDGSCSTYASSGNKDYTYDANGRVLSTRTCATVATDGHCSAYADSGHTDYIYDTNGNKTRVWSCTSVADNGSCLTHGGGSDLTYNANGQIISNISCVQFSDASGKCIQYTNNNDIYYTYDENGRMTRLLQCDHHVSDGTCDNYWAANYYTYDAAGNVLQRRCNLNTNVNANTGACKAYDTGSSSYTVYDENGNRARHYLCYDVNCTSSFAWVYTYTRDEDGRVLTQRFCKSGISRNSNTCGNYNTVGTNENYDYSYDANGNKTYQLTCDKAAMTSEGKCNAYSYGFYYTYNDAGQITTQRGCSTVTASGTCTAYTQATVYMYDEDGKQISSQVCSGTNIDATTGNCLAYNSTTVSSN